MEKIVQIDIAAAMAAIIQQYAEAQVNLEERLRATERENASLHFQRDNLQKLVNKLEKAAKAATKKQRTPTPETNEPEEDENYDE